MLVTIREYAAERLAEQPEEHRVRRCHAAEFLAVAEEGKRQLSGSGEKQWLDELEVEHNNLRAAMDFYAREAPERALRLAIALRPFWSARGHFTDGRQRLRALLEQVPDRTPTRVRALNCTAWLAVDQGDYADASGRLEKSIVLSRAVGDRLGKGMGSRTSAARALTHRTLPLPASRDGRAGYGTVSRSTVGRADRVTYDVFVVVGRLPAQDGCSRIW